MNLLWQFNRLGRCLSKPLLLITLCGAALSWSNQAALASNIELGRVTLVADEWFPMNGKPKSEYPGYMIEIARSILEARGSGIEYRVMPWDTALDLVRSGYFDCAVGAYHEDAPDFIFPEQHWGIDRQYFYGRADKAWSYGGLDSLKEQRIGLITSYSYGETLDAWFAAHPEQLDWLKRNDALTLHIHKLMNGRLDLILESQAVMTNKLMEMGMTGAIQVLSPANQGIPIYLACSPNGSNQVRSSGIVRALDEGFLLLKDRGTLQVILERYGLEPWW